MGDLIADRNAAERSTDSRPLWRQGYDAVESSVGPQLEQFVASDQFARALGVVSQLRRELEQRASRTTRHVLHRFNLPPPPT